MTEPFSKILPSKKWRGQKPDRLHHPSAGVAAVLIATLCGFFGATPAHASDGPSWNPTRVVNVATGRCLDGDALGRVYTRGCNGGRYQDWYVSQEANWRELVNSVTGRCLEPNFFGTVVTLNCMSSNRNPTFVVLPAGGVGRYFLVAISGPSAGSCLDSNGAGNRSSPTAHNSVPEVRHFMFRYSGRNREFERNFLRRDSDPE